MVYREGAFDAFDTIFAAGPHHSREVRELEKIRGTKVKNIVEQGYVLLDEQRQVAAQAGTTNSSEASSNGKPITVLVAPSWGPEGLLENYAEETLLPLLEAGMQVILRPHIRTLQLVGEKINPLIESLERNPLFSLDLEPSAIDSFTKSDVMVSAWSGVSLEYSLSVRKPVISIDVPRKNFNPQYSQIESEPIEISVRDSIGSVVQPADLHRLPEHVGDLMSQTAKWRQRLQDVADELLFHQGSAAKYAADALDLIMKSTEREQPL
jgi:YidC/Oxa1 family membrane protein insertase